MKRIVQKIANEGQGGNRPERQPLRKLPDPVICRATQMGGTDFFECLVNHPLKCQHSLRFGVKIYHCLNPERKEIAARTREA